MNIRILRWSSVSKANLGQSFEYRFFINEKANNLENEYPLQEQIKDNFHLQVCTVLWQFKCTENR